MILMCETMNSIDEVLEGCVKRFKEADGSKSKKWDAADDMINKVKKYSDECLEGFNEKMNLVDYEADENVRMQYLAYFLKQMKYKLRSEGSKEGGAQ